MNITLIKSIKLGLIAIISFCALMAHSNANECASVSFLPGKINGKTHILELITSNGMEVLRPKNYKKILSGNHSYTLEAGEHTFLLQRWLKGEYITYHRNLKKGKSSSRDYSPEVKTVHVNLAPKTNYQFAIIEDGKIDIAEQKTNIGVLCDAGILDRNIKVPKLLVGELPESLKNMVYHIFSNINATNQNESNIHPIKLSQYFGTNFDKNYSKSNEGLLISAIIPYSIADNLTLQSGDVILELGDYKVDKISDNPSNILNKYLGKISYGQQIKMTINRNGKLMTLQNKYIPVVVAEAFYQPEGDKGKVINQATLGNRQQFEFDQLILALGHYLTKQNKLSDINLVIPKLGDDKNTELIVNIGFSAVEDAKNNILILSQNSLDLDYEFSKHNKMRARSGQSLYHDYINKSGK